LKFAKIILTIW